MATIWTSSSIMGRRALPPVLSPAHLKKMKQADEWATWLLVLSPYLLPQRLGKPASDHWMLLKDKFLITANFHNALNLKETIMNYSASPSHWLFNFERYNLELKTIRTNRKDCVERTYMTKFLMQVHEQRYANAMLLGIPQENRRQVQEMSCAPNFFCLNNFNELATGSTFASGSECLPPITFMSFKPIVSNLSVDTLNLLISYSNSMYGPFYIDEQVALANPLRIPVEWQALKFRSIDILGNKYCSMEASTKKKRWSYAVALYQDENGKKNRYYQVLILFRHVFTVKQDGVETLKWHTLAHVKWFVKSNLKLVLLQTLRSRLVRYGIDAAVFRG
ncbi:hypothetical protein EDC96DRAFT_581877 [Choanephora cucurbitarum]|nr:hypothetical protein EDC96DRAFT_581877 [Choanephora cucurbitarum]